MLASPNNKIRVSVFVTAYNLAKYLPECFESILAQKVNFEYEVIVVEDCSTDNTRDVIEQYRNKFKHFRTYYHKRNHGFGFTYNVGSELAKAEYKCSLDADDFWTDETKLQQQVDFLDKNPDFIGVAHNTEIIFNNDGKKQLVVADEKKRLPDNVITIEDLILTEYFHVSSQFWRNIYKDGFPKMYYYVSDINDVFMAMVYAQNGKIKYIDKVMSCYRVTGEGVWTARSEFYMLFSNIYGGYYYNKMLKYKYDHLFKQSWVENAFNVYFKEKLPQIISSHKIFFLFGKKFNQFLQKRSDRLAHILGHKFLSTIIFFCRDNFRFKYFLYYKKMFYRFFKINLYEDMP